MILISDIRLKHRRAADGLIGVYVHPNHAGGVLLEVNCESDFVARNDKFRDLVTELTLKIASASIVKKTSGGEGDARQPAGLKKYAISGENLAPLNDRVAEAVTQLGEKISVRRAMLVENRGAAGAAISAATDQQSSDAPIRLLNYAHAVGGQANLVNGVALGKYGTLLAYRSVEPVAPTPEAQVIPDANSDGGSKVADAGESAAAKDGDPDAFEELEQTNTITADASTREDVAKLICQHIIGCKPAVLQKDAAAAENKDKDSAVSDHDGAALLDQKLLVNEAITVRQLCAERGLKLVDFERFECGADS